MIGRRQGLSLSRFWCRQEARIDHPLRFRPFAKHTERISTINVVCFIIDVINDWRIGATS